MIRRYLAVARLGTQLALVARSWLLIRAVAALILLATPYYVWRTVFADQTSVEGLGWEEMKTYLLISTTFLIVVDEDSSRLGERIAEGDVIVDVARPIRVPLLRLAECAGRTIPELAVVSILWFLAAYAAHGFALPGSALGWLLFVVSLVLASLIKFFVIHTWSLITFWTDSFYGVNQLRHAVVAVFSGAVVPIALFPSWLGYIAKVLPFQGIVNTPAQVAIGHGGAARSILGIAVQLFWLGVLWWLAELLWRRGLQQLAVQGG